MPVIAAGPRVMARKLAAALLLASSVGLGGCYYDVDEVTGSIKPAPAAQPTTDADWRAYAEDWAQRYEASPGDKVASINYARALRALTRYDQAVAVMQSAAIKAPKDFDILGAYGKALADQGQLQQAADVLSRSYAPENPNWSNMSAQGSVADRLGDHVGAQDFYRSALKIAPNEPIILNNLGLSYMLNKQLAQAEATLRQAAAQPGADRRIHANLALVLSLEGRFAEAQKVSEGDLPQQAAAADVAAVRQMIVQPNSWRQIELSEGRKRAKPVEDGTPQAQTRIDPPG
jgi:Flp pilus assembly protein TadD